MRHALAYGEGMTSGRKTLLLTGASRGIGHATVRRFSESQWRIITSSREPVPPECGRNPYWTDHVTADLSEPANIESFLAAHAAHHKTGQWRKLVCAAAAAANVN